MADRRTKGNFFILSGAAALFTLLAILLGSAGSVHAQLDDDSAERPQARLLDEFGSLGDCDLLARIDAFLITLQNNSSSRGYVVLYNGLDVLPAFYESPEYLRMIVNHLAFRRHDRSRITFLRGGFLERTQTQLWLVPNGGEPPVAKATHVAPAIPKDQAFKFDQKYIGDFDGGDDGRFVLDSVREAERAEYGQVLDEDGEVVEIIDESLDEIPEIEEDELDHYWLSSPFEGFLSLRPEWSGVIYFYADDQRYDIAKLTNRIQSAVERFEQDGDRIAGRVRVKYGGYRASLEADFFAVPPGSGDPLPKPTERHPDVEN